MPEHLSQSGASVELSIRREPTDPLAMRASIGGTPEIGYYLVWRGDDPLAVIQMLRTVLTAAEAELPKHVRPRG
jgi:hypothetical protein